MKQNLCKGILATLCGATLLAGACVSVVGLQAEASSERVWTTANASGEEVWSVNTDTGVATTTRANGYNLENFLVTQDENAVGNYSVSAHFSIAENPLASASGNVQVGIVPFYVDAQNYVMVNLWWRTDDWCGGNGNVICNITMQGRQNGEFLHVYTGGAGGSGTYNPAEYSDVWVNNGTINTEALRFPVNDEDGVTFQINKRIGDSSWGADYRGDIYEFIVNDVVYGHYVSDISAAYRAEPCYVGVSSAGLSGLAVSDFTVGDVDLSIHDFSHSDYNYNPLANAEGFVATGKTWAYGEGTFSSSSLTGVRSESPHNAITKVDPGVQNYKVSSNVSITEKGTTGASEAGLVVWQKDIDNLLNANLVYTDGTYKAVISGEIGGEAVLAEAPVTVTDDAALLEVQKIGTTVVLSVDQTEVLRYTNNAIATNGFAGVNNRNAASSFANFAIEEIEYQSFDEYETTLFGKTYVASSKTVADFTENEGAVSVDATQFEKNGYAVVTRDTYSATEVSATVTPASTVDGYVIGVIAYYANADDYYYAAVNGTNAKIFHHTQAGDEELATETYAYDGATALQMAAVVKTGEISFKIADTEIVSASINGFDPDAGKSGGVLFKGCSVTFTDVAFDGWRQWDAMNIGDWTVVGPEINTWSVAQDGTVTGDVSVKKVERNTTYALKDIEFESDYYVYGIVNVTAVHANWERRAYYFPWFIDSDNWVGVYCSQVPGMSPEIVAEAKIGGESVAMRWTNYAGCTAILDNNVVMEVYVGENGVEIYNGLTVESIFEFAVPGLAAAAEGKQVKAGVGVVDVACNFKDFTVSATRIGVNTGKPEIELIGTPVTTATVGSNVAFPIIDVIDDQGESITRQISVTGPDGSAVTVESDSYFVASAVGEYTVTVTARDSWGNEADAYVYRVTVSAAASDDPADNPTDNPADNPTDEPSDDGGCGSVVIGGTSAVLLVLGAGAVVFARKRK